jgi:hypothetical protein
VYTVGMMFLAFLFVKAPGLSRQPDREMELLLEPGEDGSAKLRGCAQGSLLGPARSENPIENSSTGEGALSAPFQKSYLFAKPRKHHGFLEKGNVFATIRRDKSARLFSETAHGKSGSPAENSLRWPRGRASVSTTCWFLQRAKRLSESLKFLVSSLKIQASTSHLNHAARSAYGGQTPPPRSAHRLQPEARTLHTASIIRGNALHK